MAKIGHDRGGAPHGGGYNFSSMEKKVNFGSTIFLEGFRIGSVEIGTSVPYVGGRVLPCTLR
eukprot:NODE_7664_length_391_cov_26.643275_g4738_i4.p3 GENE.NODE_7664_length_391_cov_26.643275_g4738_i4~~NODE_7664_length_391_cov_26.643275_g4738_i4.p3  ORF type:complete len:62 (-),score=2.04 NODE_7664_length_391_cov_26.643275_g4738_i4:7-192(-)